MFTKATLLSALISAVSAGTTLWDGRFNDMTSSADLQKWSFATPVGSYQYYIHGAGPVTDYVNLDAGFKNPADTASKQGVKITIDNTAKWNSDMWRTELIPQTTAAINKGKVFYHFSIKTSKTNAPVSTNEHQIAFFESHFTELKYGGASGTKLEWMVGGVAKWSAELVADEWHNVAYEIDFDAGSVSFHHSTGSAALTKTAGPFTASTSSNGADWHLGVLRLPQGGSSTTAEDWYFSGVYVESGALTTEIGSGAVADQVPAASPSAAAPVASPVAPVESPAAPVYSSPAPVASPETPVESPAAPVSSPAAPVSSPAAPVSSPAAPVSSPAAPISSPPAPMSTPAAAISSPPAAYSTFKTCTSSLAAAPTPPAAYPAATPAPAPAAGPAQLPKEFTIKEFIAWLRLRTGKA